MEFSCMRIVQAWDDFNKSNPLTWSLAAGCALGTAAVVALIVWIEKKPSAPLPTPSQVQHEEPV